MTTFITLVVMASARKYAKYVCLQYKRMHAMITHQCFSILVVPFQVEFALVHLPTRVHLTLAIAIKIDREFVALIMDYRS